MRAVFASMTVVLLQLVLGCSSVPDVQYLDDAGGSSGSSGSSSGTSGTPPPEQYNCTDKLPPEGQGICCGGTTLCLKCNASQCDRCTRSGCDPSTPCCAKNTGVGAVDCRAQSECK